MDLVPLLFNHSKSGFSLKCLSIRFAAFWLFRTASLHSNMCLCTICVFSITAQQYVLIYNMYLTSLCSNMHLYTIYVLTLAFSEKISILQKMPSALWLVGQNAPHVKKDEVGTKCHMGPILRKQFAQCNPFVLLVKQKI